MNFMAEHQLEIMVGSNKIVQINIDGICALRVYLDKDCKLSLNGDLRGVTIDEEAAQFIAKLLSEGYKRLSEGYQP